MTHYHLTELAEYGPAGQWADGKPQAKRPLSPAIQAYLARAKGRLRPGILYNPEHVPTKVIWGKEVPDPYGNRYRWIEYPADGLRFVGTMADIRKRENYGYRRDNCMGYYTDPFQDETVTGLVYQMPARDGKPVYIPAVSDPNTDGVLADFHGNTDELMDAVRSADHMAAHYAEEARDAYAKDAAEQRISEIADELDSNRDELRGLVRELKELRGQFSTRSAVCRALRAQVVRMRQTGRKLAKERDGLKDNYWNAVSD